MKTPICSRRASGDHKLLRRLVRNLLENARRHSGEAVALPLVGGGSCFEVWLPRAAGPRSAG